MFKLIYDTFVVCAVRASVFRTLLSQRQKHENERSNNWIKTCYESFSLFNKHLYLVGLLEPARQHSFFSETVFNFILESRGLQSHTCSCEQDAFTCQNGPRFFSFIDSIMIHSVVCGYYQNENWFVLYWKSGGAAASEQSKAINENKRKKNELHHTFMVVLNE